MVFFAGITSIAGNAQSADSTMPPSAPRGVAPASAASSQPDSGSLLPDAPDALPPSAAAPSADFQRGSEPWEGNRKFGPLSRVGIGADISPLGIGIKSAVVLSEDYDARILINFFNYDSGSFEIEGYRADAKLHLFSVGGALDAYPHNSVWRLSAGLLVHNGNNISMSSEVAPGTSFKVDGQTYYSANPNPATGATPAMGSGVLGLDARQPEFFVSGGFGRFIPRSDRHWSFPSEFGVIFMGAPTINISTSGWVCTDEAQTQCSNISSSTNPISIEFNNALQAQEAKWRNSLSSFSIYPMFSYSVVYSFDIK